MVYVERGGEGEPVLLLLHGLGATGEVWRGLVEGLRERWPGEWLVPDLPGHGRSPDAPRYSFGSMAASVAEVVPAGRPVVVLGHSLGGVVALTLAAGWFGVRVTAACGLGIKVRWSDEELAKSAELAAKPARTFDTREAAADRWLKVAGLHGLWAPDAPEVAAGLRQTPDGWRTALDPGAFAVGAPDLPGLLAAAKAANSTVLLAAGEHDPMCPAEHLRALLPEPVLLPSLGHNAHVENPAALLPLLDRLRLAN
ncbi:alpha/beta fold hydrolase [Amycolatopsis nigrescens]|uniref:alpha/beta fold hydrolase n=1 Tax=Amycolatopsis nigrescens TaxID=381445 RepID=UPI0003723113|nr:alpha/beta hydrolase [Amycolatopsis nigrescens]